MNRKVADGTMVGGMGLIARGGKIYEQTHGMADRERAGHGEDAITVSTPTKPITGVALMILYEEASFG